MNKAIEGKTPQIDSVEDLVTLADGQRQLPADTTIYQPCQEYMRGTPLLTSDVFLSLANGKARYPSIPDDGWLTLRLRCFKHATIVDLAELHDELPVRKMPEAVNALAGLVSLIESNDVWWAEQRERQYPNSTGQDELTQWLQRSQEVVSGAVTDISILKAENELQFFFTLVDTKILESTNPENGSTWSSTLSDAKTVVNGKMPQAQDQRKARAAAWAEEVMKIVAECKADPLLMHLCRPDLLKIRSMLEQATEADNEARRITGLVLEGDDENVLDSVVLDECSALATGINNDGVEAQVKFLLSNGWTDAMILKEARLDRGPQDQSPSPGM